MFWIDILFLCIFIYDAFQKILRGGVDFPGTRWKIVILLLYKPKIHQLVGYKKFA